MFVWLLTYFRCPAIYSRDGTLNKSYLSITQTILRGVADLASELKCFSMRCFGQISRVAAHLNLAYHHVSNMPKPSRHALNLSETGYLQCKVVY